MPTYDAEKANELIADAMAYVGSRPWCDVHALADALLAATQEVERLTQVQSDLTAYACKLMNERDAMRKLVGEACDIGELLVAAAERDSDMPDEEVSGYRSRGAERLTSIRHAAGLDNA